MDADFSPMSNAAGALAARGERLASHRDGRGAPGSPTRQPRWGPRPAGKARRPRTGAPAARGLRGGVVIPGVFERGATQPAPGSPTRQPRWGGLGMHRPSNAARLSPRAASRGWPPEVLMERAVLAGRPFPASARSIHPRAAARLAEAPEARRRQGRLGEPERLALQVVCAAGLAALTFVVIHAQQPAR